MVVDCDADKGKISVGDRGERMALIPGLFEKAGGQKRWRLFINPTGKPIHIWNGFVTTIFTYNVIIIAFRTGFKEIDERNLLYWFSLDYTADFIYFLDFLCGFCMGFFDDEGVLQIQFRRTRTYYMNSTRFYMDILSLLPLDLLYLSIGYKSAFRCFRLVKLYKFWDFHDRAERHTNYPNLMRSLKLIYYLALLIHMNACFYEYFLPSHHRPTDNSTLNQYLSAISWSLQTVTLMQTNFQPRSNSTSEQLFFIFELFFSLILFATVLGFVNNIVTNVSVGRKDFQ
ncbi:hypothetical protein Ciccas_009431, partial [Cichlidogyrus casuarinus]